MVLVTYLLSLKAHRALRVFATDSESHDLDKHTMIASIEVNNFSRLVIIKGKMTLTNTLSPKLMEGKNDTHDRHAPKTEQISMPDTVYMYMYEQYTATRTTQTHRHIPWPTEPSNLQVNRGKELVVFHRRQWNGIHMGTDHKEEPCPPQG